MNSVHSLINRFGGAITFLVALLVLTWFYHQALFHLNDYIFSPHGDGIKNYYTYLFHAQYDSDFWNFGGMNYPYYEHMVYTDGHPLLSWVVGSLGLSAYGIGILNFFMLISFPVCAFFLYKILRHYGVSTSWAIFAAVALAFMSPQVYRMTGHFSMAYVCAIPILWWLIIQTLKSRAVLWSFIIAAYILVFFFTHPYLGMILAFFCLFFLLVKTVWKRQEWKKNLLLFCIQVLLPIVLFQGMVAPTDTHENRLGQPAGFFDYYASWKSVFVPHDGPLNYFTGLFKIDIGNWESWNYVGFTTVVFAFFILIYLIKNRRTLVFKTIVRSELAIFMLAAHLVLLFAFCFPLKYDFLRWIVELFGPLKQFRVLGRFGWIFFYVFTVFSVVGFYKIYSKKVRKWPMQLVFVAGIAFYGFEFYPVHNGLGTQITTAANPFKKENLSPEMQELITFTTDQKYDAIIFVPFQHMSSESIMLLGTETANYDALLLSYHTQLPLMNSISSRMSLTESVLFNNFFSPEFVEKELVYQLPDSAKILVVKNMDGCKSNEMRLLFSSTPVFKNAGFSAFEFDRQRWNTDYYYNEVLTWDKQATVNVDNTWRSATDSAVWFIYQSYDDQPGEHFAGGGAMHDTKKGIEILQTLDAKTLAPGMYTASFWYQYKVDRPDGLLIAELDSVAERNVFWFDEFHLAQSTFIIDDWCFASVEFEVSPAIETVNIFISDNGSGKPFYVDELLIHRSENHLFRHATRNGKEYVVFNNYWLPVDAFENMPVPVSR